MNGSPSVKVALFIRNGGSESPCRWFYVTGIYTEKEGITKEEVQQEIGRAVSIALKSPDPQMQRFWTDFPCENETPTIEEIIYHLAEKFAKES